MQIGHTMSKMPYVAIWKYWKKILDTGNGIRIPEPKCRMAAKCQTNFSLLQNLKLQTTSQTFIHNFYYYYLLLLLNYKEYL